MSQTKSKQSFKAVTPKVNFPELEEQTLVYWKEHKTFEKSVENRPVDKYWTFLDGPPFVTGMPHYGSLLSSLPKDVFGRYYTMKGYRVRRVWGWDGHGLPIENKVEGELNIERKKDIEEKIGVKPFIERCLHYVNQVSSEWEWYVDHIGRWVDFKNAYKTWDMPYMESVMWVFKQMYEKGYIYKGLRVSLYCPHCSTPISNFEVAMDADNYKEVPDSATTYKYELQDTGNKKQDKTFILAWSTTPWNKIVTPALAVNPKFTYLKVKQNNEFYILAESTVGILEGKYEIVEKIKGSDLIDLEFVPHYDYYQIEKDKRAFVVIGGDFVTADEGTGVVTIAAYGEEDLKAMNEYDIHIEMHVDEEGMIKSDVPKFGGMYYLKANKAVNADLADRGLIYKDEERSHNVPLCWRCHTRLYYAPLDAWYVNVQILKDRLKETNEEVNWFPEHFKHGRYQKSIEHAPDWNISRNRYWGSPVPVWECECGERFIPGSIKDLEDASGQKIATLHKPEIDDVTVTCKACQKKVHRVPEVLDSWIEAGSASFAERHFPFDFAQGKPFEGVTLEDFFPPDYIAEYTGQIRAWFYVLHVLGVGLYDQKAFKNVSVTGVILGSDGRKMSKNLKNYPDPKEMLTVYGGDALRLYLLGSPVMHGEDILISEEQYRNQVKGMMLILWNTYNFFVTYANIDGWEVTSDKKQVTSNNVLDEWILSLLSQLVSDVTKAMDTFDTVVSINLMKDFVSDFSTWYIRRSRDRVGPTAENQEDKDAFYVTTHEVLVTLSTLLAPIAPFISEEIYRNLTGKESVHLADWPDVNQESRIKDQELEKQMKNARELVSVILMGRKTNDLKVRTPLFEFHYCGPEEFVGQVKRIVEEEVNVHELKYIRKEEIYQADGSFRIADETNIDVEGGKARDLIRSIQEERKKLGTTVDEMVDVTLPEWPEAFENEIKKQALILNLSKGESLTVTRA